MKREALVVGLIALGLAGSTAAGHVRGIGSGFIVSSDGIMLTNARAVNGATRIDVRLADQRHFEAKLIGVDKQSDVAVLRIDATHLPVVKLGNSADTKVGEWVVAIGSAFGFESSVSRGIVSAKSRALPGETYVPSSMAFWSALWNPAGRPAQPASSRGTSFSRSTTERLSTASIFPP